MNSSDKLHIIVAETSPIISSGIIQTINSIPGHPAYTSEVKSPAHLPEAVVSERCDILIVNPMFGGAFNPADIRNVNPGVKIIAIEIGRLSRTAVDLFDDTLSIIEDDSDSLAAKINRLGFGPDKEEKEQLSQREKEITALVVKGLTNKEIADALFISVHTVITHRRNIARKLEIHSATGLTIYAIMNHIVDLSEIKI